jgi:hypothetical protein
LGQGAQKTYKILKLVLGSVGLESVFLAAGSDEAIESERKESEVK